MSGPPLAIIINQSKYADVLSHLARAFFLVAAIAYVLAVTICLLFCFGLCPCLQLFSSFGLCPCLKCLLLLGCAHFSVQRVMELPLPAQK